MPRFFVFLISALLVVSASAQAAPRLGTVDFARLILKSKAAYDLRQKVSKLREEAAGNPRIEALRELQTKGAKLLEQAKLPDIDDEKRSALEAELQTLVAQGRDLAQEVGTFQQTSNKQILDIYESGLTAAVEELHLKVALIAAEEEVDWLFDTSAKSNSRLPALLYIRNPKDITEAVLAQIELAPEEEPSPEESAEAPEVPSDPSENALPSALGTPGSSPEPE